MTGPEPIPTDPGRFAAALADALGSAPPLPRDAAAVALAREYARQLDARPACGECGAATPGLLADLGPRLLAVLDRLGMTPAGRGVKGGAPGGDQVDSADPLDELRQRRRDRDARRSR